MSDGVVAGFDIGGTNLRAGLVDRDRNLSHFIIGSSRELLHDSDSGQRLVRYIEGYLRETGLQPDAVAVGFPSTIDRTRRIVLSTSNVPGLNNLPFADLLEQAIGVPTFINRDTNLHLLNDIAVLGLEDQKVVVGCYPGTGFGSGLWIGGQLHVGHTGAEGELGHMPVKGEARVCGCGNQGCVETIASGIYLEHLARTHFPDTPISELFDRHGSSSVLEDFVDNLSLPIATAVNILDPDAVVIGGGVIAMQGFPRSLLVERVHEHTRKPEPDHSLRLVFAEPRQDNAVMGAGLYGFHELKEKQCV